MVAVLLLVLGAEGGLAKNLDAILDGPDYKGARWGVLIVEADGGKVVYERNADQLFAPASVTKLFSCSAAMIGLGLEHRFKTPVYQVGDDLILVASGDLTLGGRTKKDGTMAYTNSDHTYAGPIGPDATLTDTDPLAGLKTLAAAIKKAGVKTIKGDVRIDARLFDSATGSGSGPRVVSPILVNDNVIDLLIEPFRTTGTDASVIQRPDMPDSSPFFVKDILVQTGRKESEAEIKVKRKPGGGYEVRGSVPVEGKPVVRVIPAENPELFARALFIEALRRERIEVKADRSRTPTGSLPESYKGLKPVAEFESPPLSEALKVTLKVSHNLYASTLPMLLAVKNGKRSLAEGMRRQSEILKDLGVEVDKISLESGAGGGDGDRVSPRVTVQLLQKLHARKDWSAFEAMLPVLGVDGTLHDVVEAKSPARGKVKAKTGTYLDDNLLLGRAHLRSKALAGSLVTAKGKSLLFCVFVNDVILPKGVLGKREGKVIGKLCEVIHEHGP